jgi:hypothetical protein
LLVPEWSFPILCSKYGGLLRRFWLTIVGVDEHQKQGLPQTTKQARNDGPHHLYHHFHLRPELEGTSCWCRDFTLIVQVASVLPSKIPRFSSHKLKLVSQQDTACDAIQSLIPAEANLNCLCDLKIDGLFNIVVNAGSTCTFPLLPGQTAAQACKLIINGSGDAASFAFGGGAADLTASVTDCDFGPGKATVGVDGALALSQPNPVSLTKCDIDVTLDTAPTIPIDCVCSKIGTCGSPFSANVKCTVGGKTLDKCLDFTEIAGELQGLLNAPTGRN